MNNGEGMPNDPPGEAGGIPRHLGVFHSTPAPIPLAETVGFGFFF